MPGPKKNPVSTIQCELLVDTANLQNTAPTVGSKFNSATGKMSETANGICATLVTFWLQRELDGKPIKTIGDFPSGMQLSLTQASYSFAGGSRADKARALFDRQGINMISNNKRKAKWYTWKSTKVDQAVAQAVKHGGLYYLSIRGDGGHALGFSTRHHAQFFDPNVGIIQFKSLLDLKRWVSVFLVETYPDLMEETALFGIG